MSALKDLDQIQLFKRADGTFWYVNSAGQWTQFTTGSVASSSVSVYKALFTQTGTSNPVVSVLNSSDSNYLGDITWTRSSEGLYIGTKTGAFTENKTIVNNCGEFSGDANLIHYINDGTNTSKGGLFMYRGSNNTVEMLVYALDANGNPSGTVQEFSTLFNGSSFYVDIEVWS